MKSLFLLVMVFLFSFQVAASGSWSGSWMSSITLTPQTQTNPIIAFTSMLKVDYSLAGVGCTSTSSFTKDGYYSQSFGIGCSLGTFDIDSILAFVGSSPRLDYWLTRTRTVMASVYLSNTFLLEYVSDSKGFGTGMELFLSGVMPGGVTVEVTSLFGMEENLVEVLGWQAGSGYDIVERAGLHHLQYESTTIELTGLTLGCCEFDGTTKISREESFQYTHFEFLVKLETWALSFDVDLKFTSQAKSISLTPSLDLGWACFDVYLDVTPVALSKGDSQLTGLEIEGIGISNVELGPVIFSSLIALKGDLYKSKTAPGDIGLRAGDYVLDPDPLDLVYYNKTNYDAVCSIEKSGDLSFGLDVYFDTNGSSQLFGLALFTGEVKYWLCEQFKLATGISIKPETGLDQIDLSLSLYF